MTVSAGSLLLPVEREEPLQIRWSAQLLCLTSTSVPHSITSDQGPDFPAEEPHQERESAAGWLAGQKATLQSTSFLILSRTTCLGNSATHNELGSVTFITS